MADSLLNKKMWNLDNENVLNIWDKKDGISDSDAKEMDPRKIADEISDRLIKIVEKELNKKRKPKKKK